LITVWAAVTNEGYLWAGWTGGLTNTSTQAVFYATGTMSAVAWFTQKVFAITATAHPGGGIAPSGEVAVTWGSNLTFTITNNPGYAVSNILVDENWQYPTNSWTFQNVQSTHTIDVWFLVSEYFTITATAGLGGAISPSGAVSVARGGDKTFTITTNFGYAISNVFVDSSPQGATNSWLFTNVTNNCTIEALFKSLEPMFTTNGTLVSWLRSYGYTGDIDVADWDDKDNDRSFAWQEYQAGTVPTNGKSVFKVIRTMQKPTSNFVSWYATTNSNIRTDMTIYRSTNLRYGSWVPWVSNISRSVSGTNDWWDTNLPSAGTPVFYRPSLTNKPWK
jgi:hypothetical protein